MEDAECGLCHRGTVASDICDQLYHSKEATAHLRCMQYSAGLVQYRNKIGFGGFKIEKVKEEILRGKKLKCSLCKSGIGKKSASMCRGATSGCAVARCSKTFHFYCAATSGDAVTRRMEVMTDGKKKKVVEYRVFCSKKHQLAYEEEKRKHKEYIRNASEESGSDEEYSDQETRAGDISHATPLDIETDSSSEESDAAARNRSRKSISTSSDDSGDTSDPPTKKRRLSQKSKHSVSPSKRTKVRKTKDSTSDSEAEFKVLKKSQMRDKRKRMSAIDDTSESNSRLSQSSLANEIGTLTPVGSNNNHSNGSESRKTATLVGQIKEAAEAVQKAVDLSKRPGQSIAKLDADTDVLLCLVETAEISPGLEQKLKKFATKMYHIPASSLVINKYPGFQMSAEHMAYLIKDITLTLRMSDFDEFSRLVLHLKEQDISRYDYSIDLNKGYPSDLAQTIYHKLRESIRENIQTASSNLERQVGWYCRVQHKEEQVRIALLALSDHTDPGGSIRSAFRTRSQIFEWEAGTRCEQSDLDEDAREREYGCLRQWLAAMEGSLVDARPRDSLLLGDQKTSVTVRLLTQLKAAPVFQQTTSRILFLRPLDSAIMHVDTYTRRLITSVLNEGRDTTIVMVMDLSNKVDVGDLCTSHIPSEVKVTMLSAWDPSREPISCLLLKLDIQASALIRLSDCCSLAHGSKHGDSDHGQRVPPGTEDGCEVTRVELPRNAVYFLPPDIKWRLVHCQELGLQIQSIKASTLVQSRTPTGLGRPSQVYKIKGDGNCFFRAMSQQITGSQNQHYKLRKRLVEHMLRHQEVFAKFFNLKNVRLSLDQSRMADDGTWATDTEIIAMASLLDTQIVIYTPVAGVYKWLPYSPIARPASNQCKVYLVNRKYHFDLVLAVTDKKLKHPTRKIPAGQTAPPSQEPSQSDEVIRDIGDRSKAKSKR